MIEIIEVFPWNTNFETGIPLIDEQHKKLINLLNLLVSHMTNQSDVPTLNGIFDELKEYTAVHFRDEEEIWEKHFKDDSWVEWHKNAHVDFISAVIELKEEESHKSMEEVIENIVKFLTHWLAYHILESDKRMAKVVLSASSGMSLAQAKKMADEEMLGATRTLISTVMTMYDQLANRTVALTREINRRKVIEEKLEQANKAKSMFLANMSHEIRTPMNAIIGLTQLMQKELTDPIQQGRLLQIKNSANYLLNIINDVLNFSKLEAKCVTLEHTDFNLTDVFDYIKSILSELATSKNIVFVEDISPDLRDMMLNGDPLQLEQVLINPVGNAIKFTPKGHVIMRAKLESEKDEWRQIRFEVEDTGIGIPIEKQANIFEAFEQGDSSTTRKYGGSGLGLSISAQLVKLMNGSISVDSTPNVGSLFGFSIPFKLGSAPVNASQNENSIQNEDSALQSTALRSDARILLVDDDEINRVLGRELLKSLGISQIDIANNGEEAVEMVKHNHYDLIFMDMQMPVMDGLDATRHIRMMPECQKIPIIAMTANVFDENRSSCFEAGMDDSIAKPIDLNLLHYTLLKYLSVTPDSDLFPGINIKQGLESWTDESLYRTYLHKFVENFADAVQILNSSDTEATLALVHRMKGAALSLAISDVANSASEIEEKLRAGNDAKQEIHLLEKVLATTFVSIDNFVHLG